MKTLKEKTENLNGHLLNYGIDGLISFNNKPLRAMIYLGFIVFFISLLYIGYSFAGIVFNGIETPGYFSTIAAILLLGGIQMISIGIVGEYIGRIYYEVKQRPKYIVQASNLNCSSQRVECSFEETMNERFKQDHQNYESKINESEEEKKLVKNR